MSRQSLLAIIFILSAALAATHLVAFKFYLYWVFDWLDIAVHFTGGVLSAFIVLWVVFLSRYISPREETIHAAVLWSVAAGITVGILWEVFEVTAGVPMESNYVLDTVLDLSMDVAGSLAASVAYARARLLS